MCGRQGRWEWRRAKRGRESGSGRRDLHKGGGGGEKEERDLTQGGGEDESE